jgi:pimeloyl-ACP methyl ester carboxylesterase
MESRNHQNRAQPKSHMSRKLNYNTMKNLTDEKLSNQNVFSDEISVTLLNDGALTAKGSAKNCILIHGWKSTSNDMIRLRDAIMKLPSSTGYTFWLANYDTNKPFIENAKLLRDQFQKQSGFNFDNSLVIGYSMGGVVARSMHCQGFKFKNLVTICSPHQGLAPWVPTPTPGTMSIAPWSNDLKNLNSNAIDVAKRASYHMFGITYNDLRGRHENDAVVEVTSATGANLGAVNRGRINLNYGNGLAGSDPHSRGMDPNFLQLVLQSVSKLF